jgi:uncharacterized membrane protein YdbT with pleckstrin-like domain
MCPMAGESPLTEGEQLVLKLHPHWKTMVRPLILLVVILAIAIALAIVIPARSDTGIVRLVIAVVAVVAAIIWFLLPLLRWRTTTYLLTTKRLQLRKGILSRSGRDFPISRISDVSFSHDLLDRLLGCGKLIVESAGEHGQLVLTEIPHVAKVQATLFQLVEDEQNAMGGPHGPYPSDH